jgi:DNA-binding response OmpR family regulator
MPKTSLVLIVEDSPTQAQKMTALLKNIYGLNVIIAADGLDALRAVDEHHPDAVILDVNLPKMDGYQVCKRLKRDLRTQNIPVIMLTAADNSQAAIQGLDAGANDYIPKDPFATDNLISTLRNYLKFC